MKVTLTLFRPATAVPGDMPLVVDAIDEYSIEDGHTPAFPTESSVTECYGPGEVRRITVHLSDREVSTTFDPDPLEAEGYEHPRRPDEWCLLYGFRTPQREGWEADGADWDTPITRDEFLRRATASSLEPGPKANEDVFEGSKERLDGTEAFEIVGTNAEDFTTYGLALRGLPSPQWVRDHWGFEVAKQAEHGQWVVYDEDTDTISIEDKAPWA